MRVPDTLTFATAIFILFLFIAIAVPPDAALQKKPLIVGLHGRG
jgi:hypothetical protein